jgi:hypothetical protein
MRRSNWTPSIVPRGDDHDVYLVVDDLGRLGRVWREADYEATDFETIVTDLLEGHYKHPIGIFALRPKAGRETSPPTSRSSWTRRGDPQLHDVPASLQDFVDRHDAVDRSQLSLPHAPGALLAFWPRGEAALVPQNQVQERRG